jgi:hypothetical protein
MIFSSSARSYPGAKAANQHSRPVHDPTDGLVGVANDGSHHAAPPTLVAARRMPDELQLRGLLIKAGGRVGKFDGEQSLYAGV